MTNFFRVASLSIMILLIVLIVWIFLFLPIKVDSQNLFTLVNGLTASTSVIVAFSGLIIGVMFREASEERDSYIKLFLFWAISMLAISLTILWVTYSFLILGEELTSIAVKLGLTSLLMALCTFCIILIVFAEQ